MKPLKINFRVALFNATLKYRCTTAEEIISAQCAINDFLNKKIVEFQKGEAKHENVKRKPREVQVPKV